MSAVRQPVGPSFQSGDTVPCSGIYSVPRDSHACNPPDVALLAHDIFPPCPQCGGVVLFQLRERVPHLREDPDFRED